MKKKVVLAYSGGLDTSVILHWLIQKSYDVICFVANVGQTEDFKAIEQKAYSIGATKVYVSDLRQEFVEQYIFKALKAHAVYEDSYLLGTAIARPLIASKQVEIAQQEKTVYLAHGATGKGNDQVRFELTYARLMPESQVISPWKEQEFLTQFKGRPDLIAYAQKYQIPILSTTKKPYSIDENLLHTSFEGGLLEDPSSAPSNIDFIKTVNPWDAPDLPTSISITFKKGIPVLVTNHTTGQEVTGSLELFEYLNSVGGAQGIGRIDIIENRFVGIKIRGIYETPAGTILMSTHKDLESITLDREVAYHKRMMSITIANIMYNGFWDSPEMNFLMAAIEQSQQNVDGVVHVTLYRGNVIITGRTSEKSLYKSAIASMDEFGGYDQADAKGFITINALRLKVRNGQPAKKKE